MSFCIKANFIDEFKIGDNVNFNLQILKILYDQYERLGKEKSLLIKPILILNTSIAEAVLYDFIQNRIKNANRTEIILPFLTAIFKLKKFDRFEHYIEQARTHDLFSTKNTEFYEAMDILRKKRNRIHIQNDKREDPKNEQDVFDEKSKILSEIVVEKIFNTMVAKYPRRKEYHDYVADFEIPWERHFKLKPKEVIKKPFYRGDPMIWSETKKKWFVISKYGEWLEFADTESTIEWRTIE